MDDFGAPMRSSPARYSSTNTLRISSRTTSEERWRLKINKSICYGQPTISEKENLLVARTGEDAAFARSTCYHAVLGSRSEIKSRAASPVVPY